MDNNEVYALFEDIKSVVGGAPISIIKQYIESQKRSE